jgi:ribose/xylose/arabinose/galactoside ABC-type transport system permease subunit
VGRRWMKGLGLLAPTGLARVSRLSLSLKLSQVPLEPGVKVVLADRIASCVCGGCNLNAGRGLWQGCTLPGQGTLGVSGC